MCRSGGARRRLVHAVVVAAVVGGAATACASGYRPSSADEPLDRIEEAGLLTCTERRSPVDGVVTCVAPEGDLTVGLTDDPARVIRNTRVSAGGPWIAGDTWVVISYDDDLDRLRRIRDVLGDGALYQDVDEVPVEVE